MITSTLHYHKTAVTLQCEDPEVLNNLQQELKSIDFTLMLFQEAIQILKIIAFNDTQYSEEAHKFITRCEEAATINPGPLVYARDEKNLIGAIQYLEENHKSLTDLLNFYKDTLAEIKSPYQKYDLFENGQKHTFAVIKIKHDPTGHKPYVLWGVRYYMGDTLDQLEERKLIKLVLRKSWRHAGKVVLVDKKA